MCRCNVDITGDRNENSRRRGGAAVDRSRCRVDPAGHQPAAWELHVRTARLRCARVGCRSRGAGNSAAQRAPQARRGRAPEIAPACCGLGRGATATEDSKKGLLSSGNRDGLAEPTWLLCGASTTAAAAPGAGFVRLMRGSPTTNPLRVAPAALLFTLLFH